MTYFQEKKLMEQDLIDIEEKQVIKKSEGLKGQLSPLNYENVNNRIRYSPKNYK